jgi:hypothetical protein
MPAIPPDDGPHLRSPHFARYRLCGVDKGCYELFTPSGLNTIVRERASTPAFASWSKRCRC